MISNEPAGKLDNILGKCSIFPYSPKQGHPILFLDSMKLTLLINVLFSYTLCMLTSLTTAMLTEVVRIRHACVGLHNTTSRPLWQRCTYFTAVVKHLCIAWLSLYIWWFLWILCKTSENFMYTCKGCAIDAKLFCFSTIPTQSGWLNALHEYCIFVMCDYRMQTILGTKLSVQYQDILNSFVKILNSLI